MMNNEWKPMDIWMKINLFYYAKEGSFYGENWWTFRLKSNLYFVVEVGRGFQLNISHNYYIKEGTFYREN